MKLSVGTASQIEASIELFLRAHAINVDARLDVDGDDDVTTARSSLALGQAYAALDRDDSQASAEAYVRKAAESLEAVLGSGDEETQVRFNNTIWGFVFFSPRASEYDKIVSVSFLGSRPVYMGASVFSSLPAASETLPAASETQLPLRPSH